MFVDTPDQRRVGIKDSPELAWSDWLSYVEFEEDDMLPRQWAKFYVENSVTFIYEWLKKKGVTFLPLMNWPERGLFKHGNSLPRWHVTWGTGYAIVERVLTSLKAHPNGESLHMYFSHKVDGLVMEGGRVVGMTGKRGDTVRNF